MWRESAGRTFVYDHCLTSEIMYWSTVHITTVGFTLRIAVSGSKIEPVVYNCVTKNSEWEKL